MNIVAVIKGEKSAGDALADTVKDGAIGRKIQAYELNYREAELCSLTGALAKAVKSVLNTPILTKDNTNINPKADETLHEVSKALPALIDRFRTVY